MFLILNEFTINVENISKKFRLYHEKRNTIFEQITSIFNRKKYYEDLVVLENISFELKKGEMLGIIGTNGSGKTTLLKLLSGILNPDKGKIIREGKIIPFLGLGAGFQPELTAIDNIILYGVILGFNKKEMEKRINSIIEFAELEKFKDTKLKNFSSGMYARLAFSIAMQVDPDILLVDEVLSVGDMHFQKKSYNSFISFKERKKSIIFVSHDMETITNLCDRVLFLHNGKIHSLGTPKEVVQEYAKVTK